MSEATLFDLMSAWMTGINAKPIASNRRMVALWIKKHGVENVQRCFDLARAKPTQPIEPVSYVGKMLSGGVPGSPTMGAGGNTGGHGPDTYGDPIPAPKPAYVGPPAHRDTNRIIAERNAIVENWRWRNNDWLAQQSDEMRYECERLVKNKAFLQAQYNLLGNVTPPLDLSPDDLKSALSRIATRARLVPAAERAK
jgi:hypothetical protein